MRSAWTSRALPRCRPPSPDEMLWASAGSTTRPRRAAHSGGAPRASAGNAVCLTARCGGTGAVAGGGLPSGSPARLLSWTSGQVQRRSGSGRFRVQVAGRQISRRRRGRRPGPIRWATSPLIRFCQPALRRRADHDAARPAPRCRDRSLSPSSDAPGSGLPASSVGSDRRSSR